MLSNSFHALDSLFFSTPAPLRNRRSFQAWRLTVRVHLDLPGAAGPGRLHVTDLGAGMTRADLINVLGIGSPNAQAATRGKGGEIDASEEALGGFYAAVCALASGAEVATKSKFDDYYEFEVGPGVGPGGAPEEGVGRMQIDDEDKGEDEDEEEDKGEEKEGEGGAQGDTRGEGGKGGYGHFRIGRPLKEGQCPGKETGHTRLHDVTGPSGTRVSLTLRPEVANSPDFTAEKVREMVAKCFEASQYSCVFSDTNDPQTMDESKLADDDEEDAGDGEDYTNFTSLGVADPGDLTYNTVLVRSRYIPQRLNMRERKILRLVEAAMVCSGYTSMVDGGGFKSETRRCQRQLQGITGVLHGLVMACNYEAGQALAESRNFEEYVDYYRQCFEIARRHKVMNPEKMRVEYGKLVYMIQDAVALREQLGFNVKAPLHTVYEYLEEKGGLGVLSDKNIEYATQEILATPGKSRDQINKEIRRKEKAVEMIKEKYSSRNLSEDEIHNCLYSICDNNSFLNSNRVPVDKMIAFLKKYFAPDTYEPEYNLAIVSGEDGARLSHSHERQYYFALQSLTLWRDILDDMFRLWSLAEEDLVSESIGYTLKDTGQGFQRVQQSPRTYKAMQQILQRVQANVDTWIGSSVVHLGDHNVPNALNFIDKYTQVPRILGPIVTCLEVLEKMVGDDENLETFINNQFGGIEKLNKDILYDFFKCAFDGSGADNFYDAGSCIDGRLTSAWNWCQSLPSKEYYVIFRLTGFVGFDGEFK
ncbi:hypothetical protein TeGR_g4597 [Tetraparma gracilis]|uniref:Non-canonical E2 ubiquitin-conjugating enzyme C-terminal domain-containing protein n=1 Tax=Tetraparma gracilis TaxID=2962635 RepID=A0ABQ6M8G3_9STRA|nr:hypothetical protein TeGR_g4597 [Tetraparma gracilis]